MRLPSRGPPSFTLLASVHLPRSSEPRLPHPERSFLFSRRSLVNYLSIAVALI